MPDFQYKALTQTGTTAAGIISAADRADAVRLITQRGEFITDLDDADPNQSHAPAKFALPWARHTITPRQRATLLRQLAVGLSAGLNLVTALEVVGEQAESPAMRELTQDLVERVTAGDSLSDAMRAHPAVFSMMQISMAQAGETAGALDALMASLSAFAERDLELREKLRSAMIYPLMVVSLGFVSILVIMLFIMPRIMAVVSETGGILPLPTRILMATTDLLRSPLGIFAGIAIVVGLVMLWRYIQTPDGRLAFDQFKLRIPILGTAVRRVCVSRFARTLGTLASSNIQIVESMTIVRDTLGNEAMAREIDAAAEGITRGSSIADELRSSGQFPQLLIQVIAMGETTGRLDTLLMTTADSYDKETDAALQRVMSIVPVLIILVLAMFVAFILAAALLPIMTMDLG